MLRTKILSVTLVTTLAALSQTVPPFSGAVTESHSPAPLRGARIKVRIPGAARLSADLETGSTGQFQAAAPLPPGDYQLEVSKPNHTAAHLTVRLPLPQPLSIELVRLGALSGRVLDHQNRPLPGALIVPFEVTGEGDSLRYLPARNGLGAQTNIFGNYRLFNLPPGRYVIAVTWASFYGPASPGAGANFFPLTGAPRTFPIVSGSTYSGIDFVIPDQPLFHLAGKITGLQAGDRSTVALIRPDHPALAVALTRANPDGTFRFESVPAGAYELRAVSRVRGYGGNGVSLDTSPQFGQLPIALNGQSVDNAELFLSPARFATLSFDFTTPACRAAAPPSVTANLSPLENWGVLQVTPPTLSTTSETVLSDLAPHPYRLTITAPLGPCFAPANLIVHPGQSGPLKISIHPGGNIEGRLDPRLSAALVQLHDLDDPASPTRFAPVEQGQFRFPALRPGRYRLAAAGAAPQEVTVRSDSSLTVKLEKEAPQK